MRDVVYFVGPQRNQESLRYSLRTLSNLEHGNVWLVGARPPWVVDAAQIASPESGRTKWDRLAAAMWRTCDCDEVSEEFVYFNDDFFVVEPIRDVPMLHRGPIRDLIGSAQSNYRRGMMELDKLLRGRGLVDSLCYEMHAPMVIRRGAMLAALAGVPRVPPGQARSLYGNLAQVGGEQAEDVKIHDRRAPLPAGPFVSTSDLSFRAGNVGKTIRSRFTMPGPYEREAAKV